MERRSDLIERLRAADRSLSEERMSRAGSKRVAKRVARELDAWERGSRVGWVPMLTFVAGAALVLLFLWGTTQDEVQRGATVPVQAEMSVQVEGPDCHAHTGKTTSVAGACRVTTAGPSMQIDTIDASRLEVEGRRVHLRAGSALFDVDPVEGDPIRVVVPQGEIVVVGTRFRVVVTATSSEVELYEGHLEFHDAAGTVTQIYAGQMVGFADAQPPAPPPEPEPEPEPEPAPEPTATREAPKTRLAPKPAPSEQEAGPVIEAAERLRREGRYTEAARTLRRALKRRWPTRTADVLSYELGRLLERRVRDKEAACAHWREHLERFESTRYRARIDRSLAALSCG